MILFDHASYNLVKFLYQCSQTRVFLDNFLLNYAIGKFNRSSAVSHRHSQTAHTYTFIPFPRKVALLYSFHTHPHSVMSRQAVYFVHHDDNL